MEEIIIAIENEDLKKLEEELVSLSIDKLSQKELDILLSKFINAAVFYGNQQSIKFIFKFWYDNLEVDHGHLDHLTRLFCDQTVAFDALVLVAKTYINDYPLEYYMEHLIDYDSHPMTIIGAKNLESLFVVSNEKWKYLYDRSVDNEIRKGYTNKLIKEFLHDKVNETMLPLPKPSYIINNKLLTHDELIDSVKIVTSHNDKVIAKLRLDMTFDEELFKIFGPANSTINEEWSDNHNCTVYGGCRMLMCVEYEQQKVDEEELEDDDVNIDNYITNWFTGSCDTCNNKILYLHYAVRKPIPSGGWIGCYCSWKCVHDSLLLPNEIVTKRLIDIFNEQMDNIGIYDRLY